MAWERRSRLGVVLLQVLGHPYIAAMGVVAGVRLSHRYAIAATTSSTRGDADSARQLGRALSKAKIAQYMLPAVRLVDGRVQRRGRRGARVPQRRKMS